MRDQLEDYDLEDAHNSSDDSSDDDSDSDDSDSDSDGSDSDDGSDDDSDDGSDDDSDDNSDDGLSDDNSDGYSDDDDEEKYVNDKFIDDDEGSGKKKKKGKNDDSGKKNKLSGLRDFWIQAEVPQEQKIFSKDNSGIPLTYFVLGMTQGLLLPILNDLPQDLGATSAEQSSISAVYYLPFYFQIFLAFLSDTKTIRGYRRIPYMVIGWSIAIIAVLSLILFSDASHKPGTIISSDRSPSNSFLAAVLFFYGFGSTLVTVATDGMIVEKYLLETGDRKGHFLVSCLAFKFFGFLISVPTGTLYYESSGSGALFTFLAIFPFILFPFYWFLREQDLKKEKLAPAKKQAATIWETIKTKSVYQSLGSLFFYLFLQIQNTGFNIFLLSEGLTDYDINVTVILAILFMFFGILVYKKFFMLRNWKHIFMATTLATAVISCLQLLMVNGMANLAIAIIYRMLRGFVDAIELVPLTLILAALSIKGSEATTFATFTSIVTFAMGIATSISVSLQGRFDITEENLENGTAGSMSFLVIIVMLLPILGLLGVRYMPTGREMIDSWKDTQKLTMGLVLIGVIALSIFYALVVSLMSFMVYEIAVSG